jgi:hypothetical protein
LWLWSDGAGRARCGGHVKSAWTGLLPHPCRFGGPARQNWSEKDSPPTRRAPPPPPLVFFRFFFIIRLYLGLTWTNADAHAPVYTRGVLEIIKSRATRFLLIINQNNWQDKLNKYIYINIRTHTNICTAY